MRELRVKEIAIAVLTVLVNIMLNVSLKQPYELQALVMIISSSNILVFFLGLLVGFLGDLLIVFTEFLVILLMHFMKLNIPATTPNILYIALYVAVVFFTGLALPTSLFRRVKILKINMTIGRNSISDFLMICGLSMIIAYILDFEPTLKHVLIRGSVKSETYVLISGIVINSILVSAIQLPSDKSLLSAIKYVALGFICSLSWLSTPLALVFNRLVLSPRYDYFVLGKIIRKLGGGKLRFNFFRSYIKVPLIPSLNKHMVIVGMSGSGKSYLAKSIVKQLSGKIPILIVDPHGEYVSLVRELGGNVLTPYENPVNPLETLGKPKNIRAEEVSDMIRRAFKLGNVQKYVLYNLILDTYVRLGDNVPTFNDVYETLINYIKTGLGVREGYFSRETLNSLLPYIELLRGPYLTSTALGIRDLFTAISVIDLSMTDSEFLRSIYIETLLQLIDSYVRTSSKPLIIVIDEAHRFLGGKTAPLLSRLVMEGRKFGLSLVVITQQPLDLDPSIIANSAFIVSFTIQEADNLNYMVRVLSGGNISYDSVKQILANLGKYEALVKARDDNSLYIIKTLKT